MATDKKALAVKIDFTNAGGIDEDLMNAIKAWCDGFDVCLLCREGDGQKVHVHAHAVVHTTKRTDNLRRTLKKVYEDNDGTWHPRAVYIKQVSAMDGALSYVYKDKDVVLSKGIILDKIKPYSIKAKKRSSTLLTMTNAVDHICDWCDSNEISCDNVETFKHVIKQMALQGYRIASVANRLRAIMVDVLANYGDVSHLDTLIDEQCNRLY